MDERSTEGQAEERSEPLQGSTVELLTRLLRRGEKNFPAFRLQSTPVAANPLYRLFVEAKEQENGLH